MGSASLALLAALPLVPPGRNEAAGDHPPPQPGKSTGRMIRLVLAYGLFGFGYVITATFISTIARSTPALHAIEPLVWLAVGLAAAPSVALWVAVGRRLGNEASYALASLTLAVAVMLSVLDASIRRTPRRRDPARRHDHGR